MLPLQDTTCYQAGVRHHAIHHRGVSALAPHLDSVQHVGYVSFFSSLSSTVTAKRYYGARVRPMCVFFSHLNSSCHSNTAMRLCCFLFAFSVFETSLSLPRVDSFGVGGLADRRIHGTRIDSLRSTGQNGKHQESRAVEIQDSFHLVVVGDLHMEDDMSSHEEARQDCLEALRDMEDDFSATLTELQERRAGDLSIEEFELLLEHKKHQASNPSSLWKCHLASLGDLGRKDIRHEQGDAGTTLSFQWAREYFDGFRLPYSLVTGNHDLEGLDEFDTDEANLQAWMDCFGLDQPQSCRYLGNKTLLLGLSTTRFRDAPYSSHEVHVDEAQLRWFVDMVEKHPADEGWKIIVLSHAPITGSGLRVLQSVHVTNGCAWLNHCSPVDTRNLFIRTVRNSPQIKMWFSGHFHLSHDYQDAISTMNQCTFCQVGVMGPVSTRDGRRQTRLVRGNSQEWKIYTIQHHLRDENGKAQVRLDATMDLTTGDVTLANDATDFDHDEWFQAFLPQEEDG